MIYKKLNFFSNIILGVILFLFIFLHSYKITETPAGLYLDETSIAINALSISESGLDEHKNFLPLYFESFGEWKNPLYIYTTSLLFKIFYPTDEILRYTSTLFYILFLLGILYFFKSLYPKNRLIWFYAIFSVALLPWFFTLSRISFEVISQLTTGIWFLYFLYNSYYLNYNLSKYCNPILSGVLLALFLYSYSTSRLLAFGIVFAIWLAFYSKKYWKTNLIISLSFLFCIIPYIIFSYLNEGALTERFELLTYLYSKELSLLEKISVFLKHYFSAFDLSSFLLFQGDPNLRHSSGFMGQIYFINFILFLIGSYYLLKKVFNKSEKYNWYAFLILLFLGSIIPSALTNDSHHSLRLAFFGIILIIISIYGYRSLIKIFNKNVFIVSIIVFFALIFQASFYYKNYFTEYKIKSVSAFGSFGYTEALSWVKKYYPSNIYFYENSNNSFYATVSWYNYLLGGNVILSLKKPQKNDCQIFYIWNKPKNIKIPKKIFYKNNSIFAAECF
jgi:hypothetical protein